MRPRTAFVLVFVALCGLLGLIPAAAGAEDLQPTRLDSFREHPSSQRFAADPQHTQKERGEDDLYAKKKFRSTKVPGLKFAAALFDEGFYSLVSASQ